MTGIYCIKNQKTGKLYVGESKDIKKRWIFHKWQLRNGKHPIQALQSDWNNGDLFDFEIIEECAISKLMDREIYWIEKLKAKENGYNATIGGKGIVGLKRTSEHCKHLSEALKGRISPMKNKRFTDEHKKKISNALKGNHNSGYGANNHASRAVRSKTTGKIYACASDAGRENGSKSAYPCVNILKCCKGQKASAFGQQWEFYYGDLLS